MRTLTCSLGGFCFYIKLKTVKPPRASFDHGEQIIMGSGMEGKTKSKPFLRGKFREEPSSSPPSWSPGMGPREEQEEVNRLVALKLASFTPIIDTVMPGFMLPSWMQPSRASAQNDKWRWRMEKPRGQWGWETMMHQGRCPHPHCGGSCSQPGPMQEGQAANGLPVMMRLCDQPEAGRQAVQAAAGPQAQSTYLVHSS